MNKIGFNNFRRFKNLDPIELGDITFLVGKNNSGKSTIVKAILLVLDYLRNQQHDKFSFENEVLNDANIVTFDRAKCKLQDKPSIEFDFEFEGYKIHLDIFEKGQDTSAAVSSIKIEDSETKIMFEINYLTKVVSISKKTKEIIASQKNETNRIALKSKIEKVENELESIDHNSRERLKLIGEFNSLISKYQIFKKDNSKFDYKESNSEFSLDYDLGDYQNSSSENNVLNEIVRTFIASNHDLRTYLIRKREKSSILPTKENEKFEQINNIESSKKNITNSISKLIYLINIKKIYYLGANPSKQSALFYLRDKENALGQAIHHFKQSRIDSEDIEYSFIINWMEKFEIGDSFDINFISGEAYECIIYSNGVSTHLSDMGMGSLQIMQLLFRTATVIRENKNHTSDITLIIEEPELNLHPALQCKLADFFFKLNREFNIKFIIETHSDNIIRKTQVIGLNENLFSEENILKNPFKVYYFNIDSNPYEMKYTKDGSFDKDFGEGFYDVTSKLTKARIKANLKKQ